MNHFFTKRTQDAIKLTPIYKKEFEGWLKEQPERIQNAVKSHGFNADANSLLILNDENGKIAEVLAGVSAEDKLYRLCEAARKLPQGTYEINADMDNETATQTAIGWALGQYRYQQYKTEQDLSVNTLVMPETADKNRVEYTVEAMTLVRDLINMPANDLGPEELSNAAHKLADKFKGQSRKDIVGEDLLDKNYPLIYAVGKAASRAPRLIDFNWGDEKAPKVTLVGKGVIFDNGGNNIKPGNYMSLMKKDMGGSAHVLGLAHMIMSSGLNIRLRVIIPAVENAISGNAMRPGDIYPSRKGLSVEIENTDAEGRLILADALSEAASEKPDLIIDFATLTGAARVALGPDVPPFFTDDENLALQLTQSGMNAQDPLWRLPLWDDYYSMMKGNNVADICHTGNSAFAGAITAALFLKKFVEKDVPWIHIDTFAWRQNDRPGRPAGGDALGMRAVYEMIADKYK